MCELPFVVPNNSKLTEVHPNRPFRAFDPWTPCPYPRGDRRTVPQVPSPLPHSPISLLRRHSPPDLRRFRIRRQRVPHFPSRQGAPGAPRQACGGEEQLAQRVVERGRLLWMEGTRRTWSVSQFITKGERGADTLVTAGVNYFFSHRDDKTRRTAPARAAGLTRALLFFRKLTESCVLFPSPMESVELTFASRSAGSSSSLRWPGPPRSAWRPTSTSLTRLASPPRLPTLRASTIPTRTTTSSSFARTSSTRSPSLELMASGSARASSRCKAGAVGIGGSMELILRFLQPLQAGRRDCGQGGRPPPSRSSHHRRPRCLDCRAFSSSGASA